jgi:V-type H+-transporting ATPase subunit E
MPGRRRAQEDDGFYPPRSHGKGKRNPPQGRRGIRIDTSYEKKFKQASMSQQITRSTVSNKSRLRILSARQELLNRLFEDANKKLGSVSKDKKKYQDVLKNLILEGAYALNEDKLQVKVRKADNDIAKKAIDEAQSEYKSKVGKEVAITIDESDPLPEGS